MSKSIQLKTKDNEKIYPYPYYPVGSIYTSTNNTNPTNYFGGTWQLIDEPQLVASGFYNYGTLYNSNNISLIRYRGTSTWECHFTNEMKDTNYIPLISAERSGLGTEVMGVYGKTTTYFVFDMVDVWGNTYTDNNMEVNIAVFGRLKNPTKYTWKRTA